MTVGIRRPSEGGDRLFHAIDDGGRRLRISFGDVGEDIVRAFSVSMETESALDFCVVAFSDGKPDSTFPENALVSTSAVAV
ncbi:MAG TPA: hypothetical protein VIH40_10510 [Xanthobacteraceae bacterium]